MLKKILSFLIAFSVLISTGTYIANANYNETEERNSMINEIKEGYELYSYYAYIPNEEFDDIPQDIILDTFYGINITKKVLNENYELDINKVSLEDFYDLDLAYMQFTDYVPIEPRMVVIPDVDGGSWNGTYTVPSGYKSVTVGTSYEVINPRSSLISYNEVVYYLSNDALKEFKNDFNYRPFDEALGGLVVDILLLKVKINIILAIISTLQLANALAVQRAWEAIDSLIASTEKKKGKITQRNNSISVTEWKNNSFTAYNRTYGDYKITSCVEFSRV